MRELHCARDWNEGIKLHSSLGVWLHGWLQHNTRSPPGRAYIERLIRHKTIDRDQLDFVAWYIDLHKPKLGLIIDINIANVKVERGGSEWGNRDPREAKIDAVTNFPCNDCDKGGVLKVRKSTILSNNKVM